MKTFALTALDAFFFRDGRPYNEKEANQADVTSVFPPSARTLSGALRAALARTNGWAGSGSWSPELNRDLGSGPEDLGGLQFTGPFIIRDDQALWPIPRHLLGRSEDRWTPHVFLRPDDVPTHCDADKITLPIIHLPPCERRDGLKPAEGAWITSRALQTLLEGELPKSNDVFASGELWKYEPRVGLRRDETTLATGEGALYSPAYVRLRPGVALGVGVAGVPNSMKDDVPPLFPLGGESRLAHCDTWHGVAVPAAPPRGRFIAGSNGRIAFTVTLLTPGCFSKPELSGAETLSACVGKPQRIGGWDSLKRKPLPLQAFAPAGSVWFCTAPAAAFVAIHALHGAHLGKHAAHGFGQITIGHWPPPAH